MVLHFKKDSGVELCITGASYSHLRQGGCSEANGAPSSRQRMSQEATSHQCQVTQGFKKAVVSVDDAILNYKQ